MSDRKVVVSGDIGGTNTRFSLVEVRKDRTITLLKKDYRNSEFPSFLSVLERFLLEGKLDKPPVCGCFAVAGPVADNKVRFTNRDSWSIDGDEIAEQLNIAKVVLINDFLAVGYGILTLDEEKECIVLQKAEKKPNAPIACIGAGTGLGECFLTPDANGHYNCFPSEGGHAEYAPRSDLEVELLQYLKQKFNQAHRVSVERVISGPGLSNVYEFLATKYPEKVDASLNAEIEAAGDMKGAVIARHAATDKLCELTMSTFATAYGSEAGVAALKWLPFGGLYLTGGLTPKNIEWIKHADGLFMKALFDKGRVSGMLNSIPIYAVMVEDLGERGAEYMGIKVAASLDAQSSVKSQSASAKTISPSVETVPASIPRNNDCSSSTFCWLLLAGTVAALAYTLGRRSH